MTASEIKIAVTLTDIAGPAANSAVGLPSAQEQQEDYQQVIANINATGGVACRKLVPDFFTANPADPSTVQATCLDVAQAGVFAEVDTVAYYAQPALASCFPQNHLPYIGTAYFPQAEQAQDYPYLFGQGLMEVMYHNFVLAASHLGYFTATHGFKKLGFLYQDCEPQVVTEFLAWLHEVGVSSSEIVTYDFGCPSGANNPAAEQQAAFEFQQKGVTTVTEVQSEGELEFFTTFAQQQGYKPNYVLADDGVIYIAYGTQHPDYANMANAVAITSDRLGEEHTPGYAPSAGTAKCNAIFAAQGRPAVYQQGLGFGGQVCDELWMLQAAVDHAPSLQRTALAAGLKTAQSVDFSYPWGPSDFTGQDVTYGGEYWRVDQFFTSCTCWRVVDPSFHQSFPGA